MEATQTGFIEDGFRVTWTPSKDELRGALALRADVFCRELEWVGSPADAFEHDEFDDNALHVVVTDRAGSVVATLRLLPGDVAWMLDTVFRGLLDDASSIHRKNAMEASRLAVSISARTTALRTKRLVSDLLLDAACIICRQRGSCP